MGVPFYTGVLEWVAVNRANRIQEFYRERYAERMIAATII